ncbi:MULTISPECIES: YfhH family protein [Aneurinibacillus]|jgi:hypothetical protein|uniref:YfhH family protein n=1 Tax=Aneurinibacillus thermoaerophilus TaxID=143495 RepID=A0A1G8CN17_ANETH|nr:MULTISPECIES: YfhH family protein [Aneurinibacillus]AMA71915.1 hypothetical protein ACH33_03045 [Aneurinibacillus sp. XH2]MED0675535.1 YfhH family protein [Aneurinibacillus thermoaerophilus]MED0680302.1 YfhH family protein [Aneurinibacillus thermoaerophilus]MED0737071.1 YfhH family protein [Aneurinibacillus thermoaerophilus]MED0757359.1 YfhH family protein [Aneurinibacillus thermoaerophilus]
MKRYSEMTREELQAEMQRLRAESMRKYQAGYISEASVLESKFFMARSYLLNPDHFMSGQEYGVIGYDEPFFVRYLNGVMAWGHFRSSTEERAFPIGRLEELTPFCGSGSCGC